SSPLCPYATLFRSAARQRIGADLAQALEHAARVLVERLAGLRRPHPPRRALQQSCAELHLEPCDRGADARLRTVERLGRRSKPAVLQHAAEGVDVVPVHCSGFWTMCPESAIYRDAKRGFNQGFPVFEGKATPCPHLPERS